jgi:hemerythrin-like domain-containing protein
MKKSRWIPIVAGGAAALVTGGLFTRRARSQIDPYLLFARRFFLSHEALRRNLRQFVEIADSGRALDYRDFGQFIELFGDFLILHHDSEDQVIFPTLREYGKLRTTDAAHLDRWASEHRDINAAGAALSRVGRALPSTGLAGMTELRRLSLELSALLRPHLESEEEIIVAERLREMIPASAFRRIERGSRRLMRDPARMAVFFAHSLEPSEQTQVFGPAPFVFRKLILPRFDRKLYTRFMPFAVSREIRV